MRDGDPFPFEIIIHDHRITELILQIVKVSSIQLIHIGSFPDHTVGFLFKEGKIGLALDRGIIVVDLFDQHAAQDLFIISPVFQIIGKEHLAECRGSFCKRQAGMLFENAAVFSTHGVDRMSQFVGERGYVVIFTLEIDNFSRLISGFIAISKGSFL